MSETLLQRMILDAALLLSVFIAPWWATVLIALIILARWYTAYEVVLSGVLRDVLYGTALGAMHSVAFAMTILLIVLVVGRIGIRQYLRS